MADAWRSDRLIYRAVEKEDEAFLQVKNSDPEAFMNATPFLPVPQGKSDAESNIEYLRRKLMHAVICLPAPASAATTVTTNIPNGDSSAKPIPIGTVVLFESDPRQKHHRKTEIGIHIIQPYQGQGYGSEAIKYALDFAFRRAGMHRVAICAAGYNPGAVKLYEKLGFVMEGRRRECAWHDGGWHDEVDLAMLEDEWRERYGKKQMESR